MVDSGSQFVAEKLRLDGSKLLSSTCVLKEVLNTHAQLYVLEEPIGDKPKYFCKL